MKRLLLLALVLCAGNLLAQKTVTGVVLDELGEGLIGATVIVKGTTTGTVSDFDGSFKLEVPEDATTLLITYIGYQPQEVDITTASKVEVNMLEGEVLEEIYVVGYGTQRKREITGSVTSIKSEDIEKTSSAHVIQGLVGKVPGVQIIQQSGQPGDAPTVRFRGIGSYNASSAPLYVVDGVPFNGDINSISNQDIESVNFIKDASANALYGSRGSNGVIIITTKRAKEEGVKVTFDTKIGQNDRAVPEYDIITEPGDFYETWYERVRIGLINSGTDPSEASQMAASGLIDGDFGLGYNIYGVPNDQIIDPGTGKLRSGLAPIYQDNWEDELFDTGLRSESALSVRSSGDKYSSLLSLGYLNDEGYALQSGFDRVTARAALDFNVSEAIEVGGSINYARTDQDAPIQNVGSATYSNLFSWARNVAPIYPVYAYDETGTQLYNTDGSVRYDFGELNDGIPGVRPYGGFNNPVATSLLDIDENLKDNISGRAFMKIKFLKDFSFTYNFSTDLVSQDITAFATPIGGDAKNVNGRLTTTASKSNTIAHQQLLQWSKTMGDHTIGLLVGHESNDFNFNLIRGQKTENLLSDQAFLNNGANIQYLEGYEKDYTVEGYLSRLNYDYKDKVFLNASFRRDGSSVFHPDNRWGNFYGVGIAYDLHQEPFLNSNFLSQFRVKASFGQQGNDAINYEQNRTIVGDADNRNYYSYVDQFVVVNAGGGNPGVNFVQLGNPNLVWETSSNANAGVELGFFRNRLSIKAEYFIRQVDDMIFFNPIPVSEGRGSFPENVGDMENKGVEVELSGDVVSGRDFTWNIAINATHFKNEITRLPQEFIDNARWRLEEGRSIYDYFMREFAGVDAENGDALWFVDELDDNGDPTGNRITTADYASADEYFLDKSAIPDIYGGVSTQFNYKNFGLGIGFAYQFGGYGYDGIYAGLLPSAGDIGHNYHVDVKDSWTPENTTASIPRIDALDDDQNNGSSYFLTPLDYISLQDVYLSYNFGNVGFLDNIGIDAAKIYISGNNLKLWSDRTGFDPRLSLTGNALNEYSIVRNISIGASITF